MDKKALRAFMTAQKKAMEPAEIESASADLARQLFDHPAYAAAKSIYGYLSFNQEVRTLPILEQALRDGKRVAVPKIVDNQMRFYCLDQLDAVAPGYYNIPEPDEGAPETDDETALILMPGLAFDRQGYRCGYGGGFYDRYLSRRGRHPTLALCYDFQLVDQVPRDEHDIPVQVILSAPATKTPLP